MSSMTKPNARPFSRDRLYLTPRDEAATTAFAALDRVQQDEPEVAMAGVAMLFATLCKRCKMDPADAHTLGLRMLRHEDFHLKANLHVETLRDFAGLRMMGDRGVIS